MSVELPPEVAVLRFGVFALDLRRRELRRGGAPRRLGRLAFEALVLLASQPQVVLTRGELEKTLWSGATQDLRKNLDGVIGKVRKALDDSPQNPRFIRTARGFGFCFIAEVTRWAEEKPAPEATVPTTTVPVSSPAPIRQRTWRGISAVATGVILLLAGIGWLRAVTEAVPLTVQGTWRAITTDGNQKFQPVVVRAGWVYCTELADGHYKIIRVPAAGGTTEPIPTPWSDAALLDVSPDGRQLLVKSPVASEAPEAASSVWILSDGQARRLGASTAESAAWRPDGGGILLAQGDSLLLANPNDNGVRHLHYFRAQPTALAWSPDGSRVRFALLASPGASPSEWQMNNDGGNLREIAALGAPDGGVGQAWLPDGRGSLLMTAHWDMATSWVLPSDGGGWWRFGSREPAQSVGLGLAAISPTVAFDAASQQIFGIGSNSGGGELLRYGAEAKRFVPLAPGLSVSDVDYAPDGSQVSFSDAPDGPLWRAAADFSHRVQLTPPGMETELPRWSPDGRWIAFIGHNPGQPWDLERVSVQGGALEVLAAGTAAAGMGAPTWAPDSTSLYFGEVECQDTSACYALHLDLKTHRVSRVAGSAGVRTVRLAPNGRTLAAIRDHAIVVMDVPSGQWRRLAPLGTGDVLNWSRDSRYIYAFEPQGPQCNIFRVRLRDGRVEPVANLAILGRVDNMVGRWFGLDPTGAPIVFRQVVSAEIFSARLGK